MSPVAVFIRTLLSITDNIVGGTPGHEIGARDRDVRLVVSRHDRDRDH